MSLPRVMLPDFRNLGVVLRLSLLAEAFNLMVAYVSAGDLSSTLAALVYRSAYFEPVLLLTLLTLYWLSNILRGMPYRNGVIVVLGLVVFLAVGWYQLYEHLVGENEAGQWWRVATFGFFGACGILFYFNWRFHVRSPAVIEARLMALQARIRPHFLFNSLNTVVGLIREDPTRAERILENLSDLYRALMAEAGKVVPLSRELELAQAYAEIEGIRLSDRLHIEWRIDDAAMNALVPPLILQPLVENAVYHGVEPALRGGTVSVSVSRKGNEVILIVRNTCTRTEENVRGGNRMALDNIRERLDLHFDAEARMSTYRTDDEYVVQIILPYRRERAT